MFNDNNIWDVIFRVVKDSSPSVPWATDKHFTWTLLLLDLSVFVLSV